MKKDIDMKISGSGIISAGEYNNISINGKVRLGEIIRCSAFSGSGTVRGETLECFEMLSTNGSSSFSKNIKAKNADLIGSLVCEGNFEAEKQIACNGSLKCDGAVKCDTLSVNGLLSVKEDITAENIRILGRVDCKGLINAESVEIKLDYKSKVESIGGGKISITPTKLSPEKLFARSKCATVSNFIEGDAVELESVKCPRVCGRLVNIGAGCKIELVQYTDKIDISPKAAVLKIEKI